MVAAIRRRVLAITCLASREKPGPPGFFNGSGLYLYNYLGDIGMPVGCIQPM